MSDKKQIILAMINFHKEVGQVLKNAQNPFFKSNYADLNAYLEVIKQPLENNELMLVQSPITNGLKTIIYHSSGESIESEMTIPTFPNDPQKIGSVITYFRRYMIASMLSLNAEDDDANNGTKGTTENNVKASLIKQINQAYIKVKEPSDSLKTWMTILQTESIKKLQAGLEALLKKG